MRRIWGIFAPGQGDNIQRIRRNRVKKHMVKGVNRNVIEISDTGSELFERAILFVRPDRGEQDAQSLETSAQIFLHKATLRRRMLRRRDSFFRIMGYLLALLMGAGIAVLLF